MIRTLYAMLFMVALAPPLHATEVQLQAQLDHVSADFNDCRGDCSGLEVDEPGNLFGVGVTQYLRGPVDIGYELGASADHQYGTLNLRKRIGNAAFTLSAGVHNLTLEGSFDGNPYHDIRDSAVLPGVGLEFSWYGLFVKYVAIQEDRYQYSADTFLGLDAGGLPQFGPPRLNASLNVDPTAAQVGYRLRFW